MIYKSLSRSLCNSLLKKSNFANCNNGNGFSYRLTSTSTSTTSTSTYPPNSSIEPHFITNRNPRNLEKLRIGEKPAGWFIEKKGKCFWLKLDIDFSAKHIVAKVIHFEGFTPVKASSKEFCISRFLYSTNDVTAAYSIGRVLGHRCLQTGITEIATLFPDEERQKIKVAAILNALEESGISLEEPDQYLVHQDLHHLTAPEKSWTVFEEDLELKKPI